VVKVEEPQQGDPMRHLSEHAAELGSGHFLAGNASKRSVTLNLRKEEGKQAFLRLVDNTDVVIENLRPGVMDRLGLSHAMLMAHNPELVIASLSGFGQTGPWRDWVAYDLVAQAAGGAMSLTGWPGERPVKMGVPIGDVGASLYLVIGLLAALRRRDREGRGEVVDVGMMDVQLALLNYHAHSYWLSGEEPSRKGTAIPISFLTKGSKQRRAQSSSQSTGIRFGPGSVVRWRSPAWRPTAGSARTPRGWRTRPN